jgi:hypothetical protein
MDEDEDRNLMVSAESMLRAGYGHKEIERALTRMSPRMRGDSGRLAVFRSLRRSFAWRGRTSRGRSAQALSTGSK